MKKILVMMVLAAVSSTFVMAEDVATTEGTAPEFSVSLDYYSKYVWRGQNYQDDGAFQPGIEMAYGNFTVGVWGNMDLSNYNSKGGDMTEVDYYVDYSGSLTDLIGYSVGLINYTFPAYGGSDDATEVYAGLSFDTFLSPSVTAYNYADEAGTYVSFAIGHSVEQLGDTPFGLELGASFGYGTESYNMNYWGFSDAAANDLAMTVALPVALGDWTLSPSINYVALLDSDVKDNSLTGDDDYLFFGVGLSTSF